jgi:nucleoid DNA-binding protein
MNKKELIEAIANRTGLTKTASANVVDAISDIATETLATGNEFDIPGVVKMVSVHKEARMGRNPQTGAQIQHPAKVVPRFKASSVLKKALNSR